MFSSEPTDQYVSSFSWNKVRYRADKPLSELVDTLQKVCVNGSQQEMLALGVASESEPYQRYDNETETARN